MWYAYFTQTPHTPTQVDKIPMQNGIYAGRPHAVWPNQLYYSSILH